MKTLIALLLTALLCGCGGGQDDDNQAQNVHTPKVDCKARPELCQ